MTGFTRTPQADTKTPAPVDKKPRSIDPKLARAREQANHARNSLRLVKAQVAEGTITKAIGRLESRLAELEKKQQEDADRLSKTNGLIVKAKSDMEDADKKLAETKQTIADLQS